MVMMQEVLAMEHVTGQVTRSQQRKEWASAGQVPCLSLRAMLHEACDCEVRKMWGFGAVCGGKRVPSAFHTHATSGNINWTIKY